MPTILLKKSDTASAVPTTANLTNLAGGVEVAVNTADRRMFTMTSASAVVELGTNPSSLTLTGGTANGVLYLNGSKAVTSGSALTFDGANLGLGVTPSAWTSNIKALEGASGGSLSFYATGGFPGTFITSNAYSDGTNWIAKVTDQACLYTLEGTTGKHIWSVAASNTTAGNAITFTQAMTLDANGDLGIGTTSVPSGGASTRNVSIHNSNSAGTYLKLSNGATGNTASDGFDLIMGTSSDVYLYNRENGPMIFGTNNTERARIDASGNLLVGGTSTTAKFAVANNTNDGTLAIKQYGLFGTATTWLDSDSYGVWGTGLGEAQVHNGTSGRPAVLSLGGSLASGEALGLINFFRSGNTDGYRSRAQIVGRATSTGTADQHGANLLFYTAADGATDPSERARITADGNLLVGTTTNKTTIVTAGASGITIGAVSAPALAIWDSTDAGYISYLSQINENTYLGNNANGFLSFGTNATERARITAGGNLLVGTTTDVSGRSGVISDISGNVRAIPRTGSAKTSVYTLTVSDVGQFVELGTGGGIDVPNGVFSTGDVVSVFNNTTGNRTISLTITTAYIGGTDADKASVTLATRGVATVLFISNSVCVVSGNVT